MFSVLVLRSRWAVVLVCMLIAGAGWAQGPNAGSFDPNTFQDDTPVTSTFELPPHAPRGVKILKGYTGTPDSFGILGRWRIALPAFERGCYFVGDRPQSWPEFANRALPYCFGKDMTGLNYGGLFALFELEDGGYLALVPIAGTQSMTWFNVDADGALVLNLGTLGTAPVRCDAPLLAWARSEDLYAACRDAWIQAITCPPAAGRTDFRYKKDYPEIFRYLGWCSWEEYKKNISSDLLVNAVKTLESGGLPVRYVLVDDGHQIEEKLRLKSFKPDPAKFPQGWEPLLSLRSEKGVKWMGVWHAFSGLWGALNENNDFGDLNRHLALMPSGEYLPKNTEEDMTAFYDALIGSVASYGFDFVKIDVQARMVKRYGGSDNAVAAGARANQALEAAVRRDQDALINCMAHNTECLFNTRYSAVTRCSIDYKVGDALMGKSHIFQSYNNALWLCQTVWGDHDMFHSSDPNCGQLMAISKALSGAPVYLSDGPEDLVPDFVVPLCYADGELLRPLAPGAPLPDSALIDPLSEAVSYRVIAPLPGGAAAVVAYNLVDKPSDAVVQASVSAADYAHASGMLQPYPGAWEQPPEGLIAYDWRAHEALKLDGPLEFSLTGFSDKLVLLCPVRDGWAVIGRVDKYLSPAAAEVVESSGKRLTVRLRESGPFSIWCAEGRPVCEEADFQPQGGGLWRAEMPVGRRDLRLVITRQ